MAATNGPAHGRQDAPAEDGEDTRAAGLSALIDRIAARTPPWPVEALAFWTAVVLPFVHLPLLVTGIGTDGERVALVSLLALNVLALYLGHGYGSD